MGVTPPCSAPVHPGELCQAREAAATRSIPGTAVAARAAEAGAGPKHGCHQERSLLSSVCHCVCLCVCAHVSACACVRSLERSLSGKGVSSQEKGLEWKA